MTDNQISPRRGRTGLARVVRGLVGTIVALGVLVSVTIFGLSATNTARFVPVLSNSMSPIMPVGSLAITLPVQRQDVRAGDVIVFSDPYRKGIRVIHRVTRVYGTAEASKFTNWSADKLFVGTKGDNNAAADPWVLTIPDAVIWRRADSIAGLGEPAIWAADPTIRLVSFVIVGIALAAWALIAIWRRPSNHDDAKTTANSEVVPS